MFLRLLILISKKIMGILTICCIVLVISLILKYFSIATKYQTRNLVESIDESTWLGYSSFWHLSSPCSLAHPWCKKKIKTSSLCMIKHLTTLVLCTQRTIFLDTVGWQCQIAITNHRRFSKWIAWHPNFLFLVLLVHVYPLENSYSVSNLAWNSTYYILFHAYIKGIYLIEKKIACNTDCWRIVWLVLYFP